LGSLESIDDTAEITVIVLLLLRKKKCELATKMKASNLSLQYLQALFYFAITSIQATSFFFWCCRGRTPVDWTKQRKATSALSKFVCYRTTFTVFVGCFFILFPLMRV